MEAVSLGEEKPADLGHDEAAFEKNRRAEFFYR
jgi:peptidoglycan-associated lipoprotein